MRRKMRTMIAQLEGLCINNNDDGEDDDDRKRFSMSQGDGR